VSVATESKCKILLFNLQQIFK